MDEKPKVLDVPVRLYGDYTCPWCYVGAVRLERVKEEFADRMKIVVTWKPLEIYPDVPLEGLPLAELPIRPDNLATLMADLQVQADKEGLDFSGHIRSETGRVNSHRALLASAYAQAEEPERFEGFHWALFQAYFAGGKNLADPVVVSEAAEEAGLSVNKMETALEESTYETAIKENTAEAGTLGITGLPYFIFGDKEVVVGAAKAEALRQAARKTLIDLKK
jgi:predicted DsbA family dithiol-disulfide isomerase